MPRFLTYTAVYAILEQENQIFLMRRANTGYRDGEYGVPAGHIEPGETLLQATVREVREEAGVEVEPSDLAFAHATFRQNPDRTYNDYFFTCKKWRGKPCLMEPDKCDDARWFDKNALPENLVPEVEQALHCIARGENFSQLDLRGGK
jgi:mutator protein MutT